MKISQLSDQCELNEERLAALAALCGLGRQTDGERELSDEEACALGVALFLSDSGLTEGELSAYFSSDDDATRRCILKRLRAALLEDVHAAQKRIDKVDCLLGKLRDCTQKA